MSCDQCFQTLLRKIEPYGLRRALLVLIKYRHTFYLYSLVGPFEREEKKKLEYDKRNASSQKLKTKQDVYAEHNTL